MTHTRRILTGTIALTLATLTCLLAVVQETQAGDVVVVRGRGRSRWVTPVTTTGYIRPRHVVPVTVTSSALPLTTARVVRPLPRRWTVPTLVSQPTVMVRPTNALYYASPAQLPLALVVDSP